MVDNRYDGRLPEPPYQTALDYDSLVAHNEALESRVKELESQVLAEQGFKEQAYAVAEALRAENVRLEGVVKEMLNADPRQLWNVAATELKAENATLRAERDFQHGRAEAYYNEAVKYRGQVENLSLLLQNMSEQNQKLRAEIKSRVASRVAEFRAEVEGEMARLREALKLIASFDKHSRLEGQCPEGCNSPEIAKRALGGGA